MINPMHHSTRRDLIRRAAAAVGTAAAASAAVRPSVTAKSASRVIGANDRIQIGCIGVGGRGGSHLRALVQRSTEAAVISVCDVYQRRREKALEAAKLEAKNAYLDYRELLTRDDIDGVFIATPDHWHAQMAIDAMAAGKDVYLEKPMTMTVDEARDVAQAAGKWSRVLQVGSQYASDPRHHKAGEVIADGEIGELLWAQGTYSRNSLHGEWNYYVDEEGTPETIDWKRWLGPAPKRPFSPERYFRWRKYWDYSGGIATDLLYHKLTPLLIAMGPQFPTRVTASGGIYVQKDREAPDTYATVIEYPKFFVNMSSSMANAAAGKYFPEVIYGSKGTIVFEPDKLVVVPEAVHSKGQPKEYAVPESNHGMDHVTDFLSCMRSRKTPRLGPELGYQLMAAIGLGVDSYREGRVKFFDAGAQRITDRPDKRSSFEGDGKNHAGGMRKRG